jgi:amidohydrolase
MSSINPERIKSMAFAQKEELIAIRRHLHANPELSFKEHKTSAYISKILKEIGIPHQNGIVETGIVGLIHGKNPEKRSLALRADIDALPIEENNEVPYRSKNKGVMHACGHDVHTTSLLGAARILYALREEFEGTIKLIFQPGEEKLPGGASLMIKEGVLENPTPTAIFGQHVFPELEAGKVGFRPGMYMASADEIYMTIKGKGGHAALPHAVVDPILISAHVLVALQQIVSRNARPIVPSVLSFGSIKGAGATNVIPDEVTLEGTFRTFNEEWRSEAHQKIQKMAISVAEGMGGTAEVEIRKGYPFLVNDEEMTLKAMGWAADYLGKENVVKLDLRMTAEDFAFFSQCLPSTFYRLGTANAKQGITSNLHTNTFDIDEEAMEIGAGLMAWLTLQELLKG